MSQQGGSEALTSSLRALGALVFSEETLESAAYRIAVLAVELVDGADLASLSLVENGNVVTLGATDDLAEIVDKIQYQAGQGPCLSAIEEQATFQIDDMTAETAWPGFSPRAAKAGVLGLLSFVLKVSGTEALGALNLYSRSRGGFSKQDVRIGALFAAQAAITVANALSQARDARRLARLGAGRSGDGPCRGPRNRSHWQRGRSRVV